MLAKRSLLAIAVMAAIASQSAWAFENHIYSGEYDTINDVDPTTIVTVVGGATAVSKDGKCLSAGLGDIKSGGTLVLDSDDAVLSSHGNFWVGGLIKGKGAGDLQNLTFSGGDWTLYGTELTVKGTYTHHSDGGYNAGYMTVDNGSTVSIDTFVADSYYSLKTSGASKVAIRDLTAAGIVRNTGGSTLTITEKADVGHLWNMAVLEAPDAVVKVGTEDEAMLPHGYDGTIIKLANDEVYVFGNGIDRDGDKIANSTMNVGTLIVSGNAMNADSGKLTVTNMDVEKRFDNLAGATLTVNDGGRADVGAFAGDAASNVMLTNAVLSAAGSSDFGNVTANGSEVAVGAGVYTFSSFKGEDKTLTFTNLKETESVTINGREGGLTLAATGSSNDAYDDAKAAADAMLEKVNGEAENDRVDVQPGTINDGLAGVVNAEGKLDNVEIVANPSLEAYDALSVLSAFQWRHDMNDLTKRMGELRLSPQGVGAWARIYGSEQTYGAQDVNAKNHTVQTGVDFDVGAGWKVGAAFSYTDGSATYRGGDADTKAYGLAAYGTWFAENGQFVDLIAKYSRLDADFDLSGMSGSWDNNAFSLSAEYGWHFKLTDELFVEPQAEVTWGQVIGDDFVTENGVSVSQDDFESLIGRLGVRAGFNFPNDRGTVYARASVLHDFKGEMSSRLDYAGKSRVVENDLGGTWYEFGLGANFSLTPATHVYVDLERTNAGKVVEDWRYNVGVRHVF